MCGQNVKRDVKGIFHACQVGSGLKRTECVRVMQKPGTPEYMHTYTSLYLKEKSFKSSVECLP